MRRVLLAGLLVATSACGDNAPTCGYVDVLVGGRNVWAPIFAVDATSMYYADYDIDGYGAQLVIRAPREGGPLQGLASRDYLAAYGEGTALDDSALYWTGTAEPTGYALYATPIQGGETLVLSTLPACVPFAIATNGTEVFAGSAGCVVDDMRQPARVTAVSMASHQVRVVWEAGLYDGDVRALVTNGDTLYIGTTMGLFEVTPTATQVLAVGDTVRHLEVHDDLLYYSVDRDGIYRRPLAGGAAELIHAYPMNLEHEGEFAIDGDDIYFAEPPHLMFMTLTDRKPQVVVENTGALSVIAARDGYAWFSSLVLPGTTGDLDTFSGGIVRVSRPCEP